MKIIFFLSSYKIGLTNLLSEQAIFLSKLEKISFSFVAGEKEQENGLSTMLANNNVVCKRINGLDEHNEFLRLVKEFKVFVENEKPDIVHVQTNWQLMIAVFTKQFIKKKYKILYTIHGFRHNNKYKSKIALLIIQLLLKMFSSQIYAASSFVYNKFSLIKNKIKILFLGVEEKFFRFDTATTSKNVQQIKIIFPGAFRNGKNQDLLIKIIYKYIHLTGDHSIRLYLPGSGSLLERCKTLTKELKLSKNIYFPGQLTREEMIQYYRNCNVAVIPTNSETFGHCIAEPFVLGLCVISRNTGVAIDIIKENENGYLFETDNELLNILLDLHQNMSKISKCGKNAFKERDIFRWPNIVEQYERSVLKLIKDDK